MGCPRIRGRDAFRAFERSYFDTMASYQVTTHSVSVAGPWALGLTNVLVVEDEMPIERKDGRIQTPYEVLVVELKRGKVVAVRTYLADPDAENVTLGVDEAGTMCRVCPTQDDPAAIVAADASALWRPPKRS